MSEFCPHLQLPWSLISFDAKSLDCVTIRTAFSAADGAPDALGRLVSDVMSYPQTRTIVSEASFVFRRCLSFTVQEEMLHSVSEEEMEGEGETFVRFLHSPRIDAARVGRSDSFRAYHYRLVFQGEILDILCCEPPEITLKQMREPDHPIAGG